MHVCVFLPYFVSVHAWKLAVLCVCAALNNEGVMTGAHERVCVALNNEDVMTGAHECVCATACMCLCCVE